MTYFCKMDVSYEQIPRLVEIPQCENITDDNILLNRKCGTVYSIDYLSNTIDQLLEPICDKSEILCNVKVTADDLTKLSKYNWDMETVDRSIDNNKVTYLLSNISDKKKRGITKAIIDKTKYITYNLFKKSLMNIIKKLPDKINILFPTFCKTGSEHWITMICWSYIKSKVVKVINRIDDVKLLDNDYPIVILDDAMYTGSRIMETIEYCILDSNKIINNEIIICVTHATYHSMSNISILSNVYINMGKKFKYKIIFDRIMLSQNHYTYVYDSKYMYDNFGCEGELNVPIYFDHKIANNFGSFPDLYPMIIKNQPSRYKIEELNKKLQELQ